MASDSTNSNSGRIELFPKIGQSRKWFNTFEVGKKSPNPNQKRQTSGKKIWWKLELSQSRFTLKNIYGKASRSPKRIAAWPHGAPVTMLMMYDGGKPKKDKFWHSSQSSTGHHFLMSQLTRKVLASVVRSWGQITKSRKNGQTRIQNLQQWGQAWSKNIHLAPDPHLGGTKADL